ncbi:hypothetical protein FRC02_009608 [Tulasnella sp. 418]|nr:hypothetical protein FRC02_009608 [Tulasnella sp. 418]
MLSLPEDVLANALTLLVSGITGLDDDYSDESTPLSRLSQKAEALDFILQAFHSHIQKRIVPVRRQINKLLPIDRLPDELLQQIFFDACIEPIGAPRYRAPTKLAAVSSRWRLVAISYTQLWSSLHSDLDAKVTTLMLQRSKSAPLDLLCSCESKSEAKAFFDILIPHSMRWRSLEFHGYNRAKVPLNFLAGQNFPLLERLTLPRMERGTLHNVLSSHNLNIIAPSIKKLEALGYPLSLRLDHSTPSMLTTLSFMASINSAPFLPTDYYALLKSTPYLTDLRIRGFRNHEFPDPDVTAAIRIDLPYLETLLIESLRYKTIGFLLSSIVTPPDRYPKVDLREELRGSLSTMFSISPIENSLLAGCTRSDWSTLKSYEGYFGVSVGLTAAHADRCLLSLIPFRSALNVTDLSIVMTRLLSDINIRKLEVDGLEILLYGLEQKLHLFPRLEKIIFDSDRYDANPECRDALERVITVIASRSSSDRSSQALFPSLRHLVLNTFRFSLVFLVEPVLVPTQEKDGEYRTEGCLELVEIGRVFDSDDPILQLLHRLATDRKLRGGKLLERYL